ncbi:hypothetical protein [Roseateles sp. P5_E11]
MSKLETISGRVKHVGQHSFDDHIHTYSLIELETSAGRVDLADASAANALRRAIEPGKSVALAILRMDDGGKLKNLVLGVYDKDEQRLFVNEEMYGLRDHAVKQFFLFSVLGIVIIPVGLAFFIIPGLLYIRALWKAWRSSRQLPAADELRTFVEALQPAAA